jgi:hypothetical protein
MERDTVWLVVSAIGLAILIAAISAPRAAVGWNRALVVSAAATSGAIAAAIMTARMGPPLAATVSRPPALLTRRCGLRSR